MIKLTLIDSKKTITSNIILNEQLTQVVTEEIFDDARRKKEKVQQIENALLKERAALKKLQRKRDELLNDVKNQERKKEELHNLTERIAAEGEVNPVLLKEELKRIFA